MAPSSLPISFFFLLLSSLSLSSSQLELQESFELTQPLPTSHLPDPSPQCTLSLLNFTSNDALPITVDYSPPANCSAPWSHAVLHLSGEVSGQQSGKIASLRLAGVEILRTSIPEAFGNGTFWNVSKDVTRYSSLLQTPNVSLSMILDDIVLDVNTDVFNLNLTILYYESEVISVGNRKTGLGFRGIDSDEVYEEPADLIIPVGNERTEGWFKIEDESGVGSTSVMIPVNAKKVVLELYVSSHGDDEFWYSNLPNSYILENNLATGKGNGAFREVFVKIDGKLVASELPFPVMLTGGINPLFWKPIVGIGAFNLPPYDFDLTPVLGSLLDLRSHTLEIGVINAIKFWLVDANLHVWLDKDSSEVKADMGFAKPPEFKQSFEYEFKQLDGSFEIEIERESVSLGWVASSAGNFTTSIEKKMKFKNKIKIENNGAYKVVEQEVKMKKEVKVLSETGSTVSQSTLKREYPLTLITSTTPGSEIDSTMTITNLSHSLTEEFSNGQMSTSLDNVQSAGGWVLLQNNSVQSSDASTQQSVQYRSNSGYFTRSVQATRGMLVRDDSTYASTSMFHKIINVLFDTR